MFMKSTFYLPGLPLILMNYEVLALFFSFPALDLFQASLKSSGPATLSAF